jgi:hypothetical protein
MIGIGPIFIPTGKALQGDVRSEEREVMGDR